MKNGEGMVMVKGRQVRDMNNGKPSKKSSKQKEQINQEEHTHVFPSRDEDICGGEGRWTWRDN